MFKRIDDDASEPIEGFSYFNKKGNEEFVRVSYGGIADDYVDIKADDDSVCIYKQDIPKLISALQAAYDFKGN